MNKKTVVYSLMFLSFIALAGTGIAFAAESAKVKDATTTPTTCNCGCGSGECGMRRGGGGPDLEIKAEILGMTVDDLKTSLEAGKKFSELVSEKGLDLTTVQTQIQEAMKTKMQSRLAQDVADGKITQAQADEMLTNMANGKMGAGKSGCSMGGPRVEGFGQPAPIENVE